MPEYRMPGVYVEELTGLPPAVTDAATAVPPRGRRTAQGVGPPRVRQRTRPWAAAASRRGGGGGSAMFAGNATPLPCYRRNGSNPAMALTAEHIRAAMLMHSAIRPKRTSLARFASAF